MPQFVFSSFWVLTGQVLLSTSQCHPWASEGQGFGHHWSIGRGLAKHLASELQSTCSSVGSVSVVVLSAPACLCTHNHTRDPAEMLGETMPDNFRRLELLAWPNLRLHIYALTQAIVPTWAEEGTGIHCALSHIVASCCLRETLERITASGYQRNPKDTTRTENVALPLIAKWCQTYPTKVSKIFWEFLRLSIIINHYQYNS